VNQFQKSARGLSTAYLSSSARTVGRLGPSLGLPTTLYHEQRDSRSSRGSRTPWGRRCYGYLPARGYFVRGQALDLIFSRGLQSTCRGLRGSGLFHFHPGSQLRRQALADLLPSHSKFSVSCVPNQAHEALNAVHENPKAGSSHDR
jgi:hypothetical protein